MTSEAGAETRGKRGLVQRLIGAVRSRIRRLFRKDDPNIYPFF